MEKTLFYYKSVSIKYIKKTFMIGISFDKPDLYIVLGCFIIEVNFRKAKKYPETF